MDDFTKKFPHLLCLGCAAHGLNLLAKDILQNSQKISKTVSSVKDIIKFFKNKHIPRQVLKNKQLELNSKETCLSTMVETRWLSITNSLESLVKCKEALLAATIERSVSSIITPNLRKLLFDEESFWPTVQNTLEILSPISSLIRKLEGDDPQLPIVLPEMKKLEDIITTKISNFLNNEDQHKIKKQICLRKEFILNDVHLLATQLHPLLKDELTEEEQALALNLILKMADDYKLDVDKILADLANYKTQQELWAQPAVWRAAQNCGALTWWKAFCPERELTKIAIKVLSIPATSASSERNWSAFSNIKTKKRNKLTIERTNKLVSIKFNLELFKAINIDERYKELQSMKSSESENLDTDIEMSVVDSDDSAESQEDFNEYSSDNSDYESENDLDDLEENSESYEVDEAIGDDHKAVKVCAQQSIKTYFSTDFGEDVTTENEIDPEQNRNRVIVVNRPFYILQNTVETNSDPQEL